MGQTNGNGSGRDAKLTAIIEAFGMEMHELGVDFAMVTRDPELQDLGVRLGFAGSITRAKGESLLRAYLNLSAHPEATVESFRVITRGDEIVAQ